MKKGFLMAILIAVIAAPILVGAATCKKADGTTYESGLNLCYPEFGGININDPGQQSITAIVAWLYTFFVMLSGLAAFVMIVWGGVQWMTSQGNSTATSDAKDKIQKALLGLLLVLASFLILQIINPELTTLRIIGLTPIERTAPQSLPLELMLTANNQESSVKIKPGESVTLAWNMGSFISCQVGSDPSGLWDGEKTQGDSPVAMNLPDEGIYVFSMGCEQGQVTLNKTVRVIVSSLESTEVEGQKPIVAVQVNGYDGPLTLPSDELPRLGAKLTWASTNADRCFGEDLLHALEGGASGSFQLSFSGISNGIYRYTITCINLESGMSGSDTVVITVDI